MNANPTPQTSSCTTKRSLKERLVWPGMVFFLLGMSTTTVTTTVILATGDKAFAVEEDYYAKAVAWDETSIQRAASEALGWTARAEVSEPDLSGSRAVTVWIEDAAGRPVDVSTLRVFAFHHARRADTIEFPMVRIAPGRYAAGADMDRPGKWQLRVRGERGSDLFLSTLETETPDSPGIKR